MKGSAGESKYLNSICYFVSHELSNTNLSRKDAKPYVLLFLCLKLWHADHADFRRLFLSHTEYTELTEFYSLRSLPPPHGARRNDSPFCVFRAFCVRHKKSAYFCAVCVKKNLRDFRVRKICPYVLLSKEILCIP